jgi:hypothetical protein
MIRISSEFPDNVVAIACEGRVTRKDYDDVLVPAVKSVLQRHQKIRLYYEITPQFSSIEPGAIWEDFILGVETLFRWERVAVVTEVAWIRHAVNAFRFLMPAEVRVFGLDEAAAARDWIVASQT